MVKRRLVIVLNGKLNGNSSIVVPLSTTKDETKLKRRLHVQLEAGMIRSLRYFAPKTCWVKCDWSKPSVIND
nr:type II toxin-antitoxin system PemK/MazF family toxin [Rahnella woolbedingensis]